VRDGKLKKRAGNWIDHIDSLQIALTFEPAEEKTICFTLGAASSREEATNLIQKISFAGRS